MLYLVFVMLQHVWDLRVVNYQLSFNSLTLTIKNQFSLLHGSFSCIFTAVIKNYCSWKTSSGFYWSTWFVNLLWKKKNLKLTSRSQISDIDSEWSVEWDVTPPEGFWKIQIWGKSLPCSTSFSFATSFLLELWNHSFRLISYI